MNARLPTIKTGTNGLHASFNSQLYRLIVHHHDGARQIDLGYAGSRVLERLLQCAGEVVSREELLSHAWRDRVVSQGSLNQQIYTLRQALGDEKQRQIIQTLPRRGYLLNPQALENNETPAADPAGMADVQASILTRLWTRLRSTRQNG